MSEASVPVGFKRGEIHASITRGEQVIDLGCIANSDWNWIEKRFHDLRLRLILSDRTRPYYLFVRKAFPPYGHLHR